MPSGRDPQAPVTSAPDGAASGETELPFSDPASYPVPQMTRALVDGVGVYDALGGSPFLTAPLLSTAVADPGDPRVSPAVDGADPVEQQLRHLREPLRRQVQGVPLRLRLSEAEVSGLVTAILELIARHIPAAHAEAHRGS